MQQASVPIITIDGPVASGKGSVSEGVAKVLGFNVLDSGSLYRLAALCCLRANVNPDDEGAVETLALQMDPVFKNKRIYLQSEDVTDVIREEVVGLTASKIATSQLLRKALFDVQRRFARAPGLVADGRDMGSVVFPEAKLKIFLTASAQSRAQRRFNQLKEKGITSNIDNLVADLEERDRRDMMRSVAPLKPAEGARILDSSSLSLQQTIDKVLEWYRESGA